MSLVATLLTTVDFQFHEEVLRGFKQQNSAVVFDASLSGPQGCSLTQAHLYAHIMRTSTFSFRANHEGDIPPVLK